MPKAASEPAPQFDFELVVVESFDGHARGEVIADPDQIKSLLESGWAGHCVKRAKTA